MPSAASRSAASTRARIATASSRNVAARASSLLEGPADPGPAVLVAGAVGRRAASRLWLSATLGAGDPLSPRRVLNELGSPSWRTAAASGSFGSSRAAPESPREASNLARSFASEASWSARHARMDPMAASAASRSEVSRKAAGRASASGATAVDHSAPPSRRAERRATAAAPAPAARSWATLASPDPAALARAAAELWSLMQRGVGQGAQPMSDVRQILEQARQRRLSSRSAKTHHTRQAQSSSYHSRTVCTSRQAVAGSSHGRAANAGRQRGACLTVAALLRRYTWQVSSTETACSPCALAATSRRAAPSSPQLQSPPSLRRYAPVAADIV